MTTSDYLPEVLYQNDLKDFPKSVRKNVRKLINECFSPRRMAYYQDTISLDYLKTTLGIKSYERYAELQCVKAIANEHGISANRALQLYLEVNEKADGKH